MEEDGGEYIPPNEELVVLETPEGNRILTREMLDEPDEIIYLDKNPRLGEKQQRILEVSV